MKVGNNCVIRRGVYLGSPNELEVGDGSFIGRASLYCTGGIKIGKNVNVSDGVVIITAKRFDVNSPAFEALYEPITVNDWAWIATNAIVLAGVTVGRRRGRRGGGRGDEGRPSSTPSSEATQPR